MTERPTAEDRRQLRRRAGGDGEVVNTVDIHGDGKVQGRPSQLSFKTAIPLEVLSRGHPDTLASSSTDCGGANGPCAETDSVKYRTGLCCDCSQRNLQSNLEIVNFIEHRVWVRHKHASCNSVLQRTHLLLRTYGNIPNPLPLILTLRLWAVPTTERGVRAPWGF